MTIELKIIGKEIEDYAKVYQETLHQNVNGKRVEENLHLIFITIIIKNIDSLNSISKLIQNVAIEHSYFSIASLIRGNLLNGIVALYLANKIEPEKTDSEQMQIKEEIEKVYIDQLKYTLRDIKYLLDSDPTKDSTSIIESINRDYDYYLKNPILNLNDKIEFIHNQQLTPKYMVNNSRKKDLSLRIYDSYIYYSKMEHIGLLTYKFFTRIYDKKQEEIQKMKNSIYDIVTMNQIFKEFLGLDKLTNHKLNNISIKLKKSLEN